MAIQLMTILKPRISRTCFIDEWQQRSCRLWHCTMPGTEPGVGGSPAEAYVDWYNGNFCDGLPTNSATRQYRAYLAGLYGVQI